MSRGDITWYGVYGFAGRMEQRPRAAAGPGGGLGTLGEEPVGCGGFLVPPLFGVRGVGWAVRSFKNMGETRCKGLAWWDGPPDRETAE